MRAVRWALQIVSRELVPYLGLKNYFLNVAMQFYSDFFKQNYSVSPSAPFSFCRQSVHCAERSFILRNSSTYGTTKRKGNFCLLTRASAHPLILVLQLGLVQEKVLKLETPCARWHYIPVWQNKAISASTLLALLMSLDHNKNGFLKHP